MMPIAVYRSFEIPLNLKMVTSLKCLAYMSIFMLFTLSSGCGVEEQPRPNIPFDHLVINEVASTNTDYHDDDGESPDWIELYNASEETISLAGWSITDKENKPAKWVFPHVNLAANNYLRIWASGKGESGAYYGQKQALHTNFKISSSGETLYLFSPSSIQIHSLETFESDRGVSTGLSTQTGERVVFEQPTPGSRNAEKDFIGIVDSRITISFSGDSMASATAILTGAEAGQVIRYTLDASVPSLKSPVYDGPVLVSKNEVIRASAFYDGHLPGEVSSKTLLIDHGHDIPVMSLVTENRNFFDKDYGIYYYEEPDFGPPFDGANFWEDWERDIHVSFYEPDGTLGFELNAGVKIFGGATRTQDQRSLAIFARKKYGAEKIKYPLFPNRQYSVINSFPEGEYSGYKSYANRGYSGYESYSKREYSGYNSYITRGYSEFKSFVLRNSGNDWMRTMLRDAAATSLMEGTSLDFQAYRPVAVYLNGEYWGLHNLREKVNEDFLSSRHGFDKDEFTIMGRSNSVIEGDGTEYWQLVDFLENNSLENDENYQFVADQVDIENFSIYQIAQIYFDNHDWPGNNIKWWKTDYTRWRWILYDTDFGFGIYNHGTVPAYSFNTLNFALEENGPDWPNPPWATLMLRRLLENDNFKNYFVSRFADELNSRFIGDRVSAHIDMISQGIASEIPAHFSRWYEPKENEPENPDESFFLRKWNSELARMKTFARRRPAEMRRHIMSQFDLEGLYNLTLNISDSESGSVKLNSLKIVSETWNGEYFAGVPVRLSAVPAEGYVFSHWLDANTNEIVDINLELMLTKDTELTAIFMED